MRVRVVSNIPTPYNDALFAELARRPHLDLHVAYCAEREANRSWVLPAEKPYEYTMLPGWTLRGAVHVNPGVGRWLARQEPDVAILSGGYSVPTIQAAAWFLHRRGTPWLFWGEELGSDPLGDVRARLRSALRLVLRRATGVLAIGTRACRSYEALGIPATRIHDFHYYPDVEHFRLPPAEQVRARTTLRRQWGIAEEAVVFAFCGQLIDRKGVDTLLAARSAMTAGADECVVVVIGDGPELARYERMGHELGIADAVRFVGFAQPSELPRWFAASDALVLPSRREGWGLVVGEAMAAGLPVVASSAVNAAVDLIAAGGAGFVVPPGDHAALAGRMDELLGSAGLRSEMRHRAGRTAEEESPRRAAERLETILREALGARPAPVSRSVAMEVA